MTSSGDDQVDAAVSGTGNVVAGGQGNKVLSGVSAGGDVAVGDKLVIEHVEHLVLQSPAGATVWSWPRPWDFGGYLQEKRKGFTGRQWLFDQVSAWHHDSNAPQALLIEADFGVGKSAFMAELCATGTTQRQLPVVAHHFCDHNTAATLEAGTFLRSLAAQLALALPAYKAAVESDPAAREWLDKAEGDPASAFSQAIASKLAAIEAPSCHQLLLVDGLDETLGAASLRADDKGISIVALLAGATARLPGWLRVLTTSRGRQKVRQPLQQAYKCQELDAEQADNLDDIRDYVKARCQADPLASLLAAAANTQTAESVAELLRTKSEGKFLYPVRVLNDLASGSLEADRLEDLPPGMDGFYLEAFHRRFPSADDYTAMGPLLGLLGQAQEPLDRGTLAAILAVEEQRVQQALLRIEDFLRITPKGQGPPGITTPTYDFDHLSLTQWLSEENDEGFPRAGDFTVDAGAARSRFAGWAKGEVAAGRAHQWPYLTRHMAAHLDPADRAAVFGQLLLDLPWLRARLRWAELNALLADFQWAEGQRLHSLELALRQGAHVLAQHPYQLPVQLLARWPQTTTPPAGEERLRQQAVARILEAGGACPLAASLQQSEDLLRILITGHESIINALAVLPDGRLASGADDGAIRLWDPASGACTATLEGHTGSVFALAVLKGGRLASGAGDRTIRLWDPATGACAATLEGHNLSVMSLAVLPDGRLVSGSDDGIIKVWDPVIGACQHSLESHSCSVLSLAILPDGCLASGQWDHSIKLWNLASGACQRSLDGHSGSVLSLALLPHGRLVSGSADGLIKVWDVASGACSHTLNGHSGKVLSLAVLDGQLASGAGDGTIRLWDTASGTCAATFQGHTRWVKALAVFPDGRFASGSWDETIKLWDPTTGACQQSLEGHSGCVSSLGVLLDGRLVSGSWDETINLWDPESSSCTATFHGHNGYVRALAVLPDGRLASGSDDQTIKLWDPATGACSATLEDHSGWVSSLGVLHDGYLISGSWDETIKLWDLVSGACTATLEGHSGPVLSLAILPDGCLASGQWDHTIKLWDLASGAFSATLEGHSGKVWALAVLPDGRLVSGSSDHTIKLWDLSSCECAATLEGHSGEVLALAVLPDGRLASGSSDRTILLWDPATGSTSSSHLLFMADAYIHALAFLPGASILLAGDARGRLHWFRLWEPPSTL